MKKISVGVPMYNEEIIAEESYKRITKNMKELEEYDYEIIIVNDGSTDKTKKILENISKKDKKIKIINFSRNFGHQAAITAGLKYTSGDAVVIMDADMQDPPELIKDMIKLWQEGHDVIYAVRKEMGNQY